MSRMAEIAIAEKSQGDGIFLGLIACLLAVKGILIAGTFLVPLAAMVALFGTLIAMKAGSLAGVGVAILAWVLVIMALLTSPFIFAVFMGLVGPFPI